MTDHTVWIFEYQYRRLGLGEEIRVPFRESTKRPLVGDVVEVRASGVVPSDQAEHARQAIRAEVASVEDDSEVTATLKLEGDCAEKDTE